MWHSAGERSRGTANQPAVRGHLRYGFHAGAQLRAELLEDVHARRPLVGEDQRRGGQDRTTFVDYIHGPVVGHRPAVGSFGGHKVFRLQVSQVYRSHRTRYLL